ncbi:ribulose-phosphate 3-epimerase [uncultured Bacteroides sp.]|uniref:ribulose-phosphate 3-epimerase n=1 Tax=uncultured Bacteroides sp. TaxID=162156 RepID=UPI002604579D|nr:ribulose-phosphate 3-epimerase [uncultured Bacteroides sp.]
MLKEAKISASMMCADLVNLRETIRIFEKVGIDYLHIDVMDGEFVPNFGLGSDYIRGLRELTKIPLDIHMMVASPEYKFKWVGIQSTDTVSIHYESTTQIQRTLDWLAEFGCRRFLAINPATPIYVLEEVLDYIDGINLLMVNPGFAGQKIVPSTIKKAERLVKFLSDRGKQHIEIEVDGNITFENAKILRNIGANMFVAGTSSVFRGSIDDYSDNIRTLKQFIIK